jgi:hypothetical protein
VDATGHPMTPGPIMPTRVEPVDPAPAVSGLDPEIERAAQRVELRIALDLARHAAIVAPVVILGAGLWRGTDAALAAAAAIALVVANWLVAGVSLGWAARHAPEALVGVALFGFLFRLAAITAVGAGIKAADVVDWPVFCGVLLAGYGGLLIWELRSISFSLASPGLKPKSSGVNG